jgi:hypothetical protein
MLAQLNCYETSMFITAFTRAHTGPYPKLYESSQHHYTLFFLGSSLILLFHPRLVFPSALLDSGCSD